MPCITPNVGHMQQGPMHASQKDISHLILIFFLNGFS